ncbi:unnamed protein product, partial [Allacma fusca]
MCISEQSFLEVIVSNYQIKCGTNGSNPVFLAGAAGSTPTHNKLLGLCLPNKDKVCPNWRFSEIIGFCYLQNNNWKNGSLFEHGIKSCKSLFPHIQNPHGLVHCTSGDKNATLEYFTSIDGYTIHDNMSLIWEDKNIIQLQEDDQMERLT